MAKHMKDLNVGDKVNFGRHQINNEEPASIIWRIVAKNHVCEPAYPNNAVTLNTDKVIDFRAYDASEPDNPDSAIRMMGNCRYIHSNLHQWLNSSAPAGSWYTPQHSYDAPPDTSASVKNHDTQYAHIPGFMHFFTSKENDAILTTHLRVEQNTIVVDGGIVAGDGYDDFEAKIFIPSATEIEGDDQGSNGWEGPQWAGYTDNNSRIARVTQHSVDNTACSSGIIGIDNPAYYWLRTPMASSYAGTYTIQTNGTVGTGLCAFGYIGVRPALNISGDTYVSDTTDEDGCYTVIFNDPPVIHAASSGDLGVQTKPLKQIYTLTDPDGNPLTVTEKLNGAVIRTLSNQPSGVALTLDLTSQWQTLALDTIHTIALEVTDGLATTTDEWTFSRSNDAPIITASASGNLGKLVVPLCQAYTVDDPNQDVLTVSEVVDGDVIRTLQNQPSGTALSIDLTELWPTLSKDTAHSASIEVTDGLITTVHTWTFNVIDPIGQQLTGGQSTQRPTAVVIPVLPVQVLVSNNTNDADPIWEDASEAYRERKQYSFKNETKTADEWCVGVKYTVNGVAVPVKLTTIHGLKQS